MKTIMTYIGRSLHGLNNEPSSKRLITFLAFMVMVFCVIVATFTSIIIAFVDTKGIHVKEDLIAPVFMFDAFKYTVWLGLGLVSADTVTSLVTKSKNDPKL